MSAFVLQRGIRSEVGKAAWFDAERFDDKERALFALKIAKAEDSYYVNGDGGYGYTGLRSQPIRLVEVVS